MTEFYFSLSLLLWLVLFDISTQLLHMHPCEAGQLNLSHKGLIKVHLILKRSGLSKNITQTTTSQFYDSHTVDFKGSLEMEVITTLTYDSSEQYPERNRPSSLGDDFFFFTEQSFFTRKHNNHKIN